MSDICPHSIIIYHSPDFQKMGDIYMYFIPDFFINYLGRSIMVLS